MADYSLTRRLILRTLRDAEMHTFTDLLAETEASPSYLCQILDKMRKAEEITVHVDSRNCYRYGLPPHFEANNIPATL
jgi:DNA-binding IscR family transcriptional regulator